MNIKEELRKAWTKASSIPGSLEVLTPNELQPGFASQTIIKLLESTYANHAISHNPMRFEQDITAGMVRPWIVTRDSQPVACAALIAQSDGTFELGRAVSVENGSGAGKLAMLTAAQSSTGPLVAEVRLADEFAGIFSGEATQRICFGILELVPHAVIPAFAHGSPKRNEMFAFSATQATLPKRTIIQSISQTLSGRDFRGVHQKLAVVQESPVRVAVPSDSGISLTEFHAASRFGASGCSMVSLEVTDQNLATIAWLSEHEFVTAGLDRIPGQNGLPVILLATLAHGTILSPTKIGNSLPQYVQRDIHRISEQFTHILGGN